MLVPPERADELPPILRRLRRGERVDHFETVRIRKDGRRIHVSLTISPIKDAAGRITGTSTIARDISERKRAEGQLRETNQYLSALIQNSPLAIFALDRDRRVNVWNAAAEHMLGWNEEEVRGGPVPWIPPEKREEFDAFVAQAFDGQLITGQETQRQRRDGARLEISLSLAPLYDAAGAVNGCIGFIADITGQKRLEGQFRQSQKMEAIGRLASGVAHDFNNMLTVITGYSDLLLGTMSSADPSRDLIGEIRKSGERATTLTRQLLAFSRQQTLTPVVLDVNSLITDLQRMLRRLIPENIDVVTTLSNDLWRVKADPGQLDQVIMNLAINARDAMPQGGSITLATHNTELDESYTRTHPGVQPGAYVQVTVCDTGCGMDEQTQLHIFEPFFTTKEIGKGTGLGLATVYGIVKQSGGHISLQSAAGQGTTFRIYLPRVTESAPAVESEPSLLKAARGTETVLLVEDEDKVRSLGCLILRSNGYTVLEARDGPDALAIAEQMSGPIHLVVTDVVMPQMSVRQLVDRLTVRYPALKVLYCSGHSDEALEGHGIVDKDAPFLQKPFSLAALARKVREVLDRSSQGS
jgi:PAS domain S-box-containing protein